MKVRDSGMAEEAAWECLFDVPLILDRLRIDGDLGDVTELGCGYGTFTIPIARRIAGRVLTFDIDRAMVERTRRRADENGLTNVRCEVRDILKEGYGQADGSADACLLFNILHLENPVDLLRESARILAPGGVLVAIHWQYDAGTPRGPSLEIRPRPQDIFAWCAETGCLEPAGPPVELPPWHYGVRVALASNV